jgi:hypothetical protein
MFDGPGLLTDQQSPYNLSELANCGYEWLSFQHYNPKNPAENNRPVRVDYDFGPARAAGLNPGVWGVTYGVRDQPDAATFYADGKGMAEQAVRLRAGHLIVDAEMCWKGTRGSTVALRLFEGIRAGGWSGPVSLTTLGAPVNPKTAANPNGNDYGMETRLFLDLGGYVLPQEYLNEHEEYAPHLCLAYWTAVGVPRARLNHMIALYSGLRGRIDGAHWKALLKAIAVNRNFSVYMAQHGTREDYLALVPSAPAPPSAAATDPKAVNARCVADADSWLLQQAGDKPLSRLRIIRRIAATGVQPNDPQWIACRDKIKAALDQAGIP